MNSAKAMSMDEFLASKGVSSPFSGNALDKCRFPHGLTKKGHDSMMKLVKKQDDDYYGRRNAARAEYKRLVTEGTLRPYTKDEEKENRAKNLIRKANGDPNFESTQAARRVCDKRGINWRCA